jgi:hypothetical protein
MRIVVLVVLALTGTAHAGEPGAEDWVGTWNGKARAKGCVDGAAKTIALDVAITPEGTLRSSGDAIVEGWGDLDWYVEGKRLVLANQGLTGSLTRSKKTVKLVLASDGGCVVKATLARPTSGIASCDRLRGLATVKAQCPALPSDTRGEALTEIEASWSAWKKLKGKKRKAQATACAGQAAALATEVASCASTGGLAECDRYVALMEGYLRCDQVPQQARDAARQGIDAMKASLRDTRNLPTEARQAAEDACKQAADALRQAASTMGCAL